MHTESNPGHLPVIQPAPSNYEANDRHTVAPAADCRRRRIEPSFALRASHRRRGTLVPDRKPSQVTLASCRDGHILGLARSFTLPSAGRSLANISAFPAAGRREQTERLSLAAKFSDRGPGVG